MPLVVQFVVGQFQLVKADHLTHPRLSRSRGVRVDVDPGRHRRVRVPRHHPLRAVVHVPSGVGEEDGLLARISFGAKTHLDVGGKLARKWIPFLADDSGNLKSMKIIA